MVWWKAATTLCNTLSFIKKKKHGKRKNFNINLDSSQKHKKMNITFNNLC